MASVAVGHGSEWWWSCVLPYVDPPARLRVHLLVLSTDLAHTQWKGDRGVLEILQTVTTGGPCTHEQRLRWWWKAAARAGHLEVLQWLRAQGCPWDTWTCRTARCQGHVDVLEWCRANGAPE